MIKIPPSNKVYELKASKKSYSDFNEEKLTLLKGIESNHIVTYKICSKNNIKQSRNFLPKPIIESEKDIRKDFHYENQNNYIFQYYETTIEHLKKLKKMNIDCNDIFNIKNNFRNNKDKSINEEKSVILSKINTNLNIKSDINNYKNVNNLFLNNSKITKFNFNIGIDTSNTKTRESKINIAINDKKKLNANISEEKPKDNLKENEIKNLIINIDYPPFKPSSLNDKKENNKSNITKKSSLNTILDSNSYDNIKNEEDEYIIEMFGKKGWICLLCNNFNYDTRIKCNRCGELKKPKKITKLKTKILKEQNDNNQKDNQNKDWFCSNCNNFNYCFRDICNRCKIPKTIKIIYNFNPTINNYISCNYALYQQPFFLFNNFQNIYINNIANFMYK